MFLCSSNACTISGKGMSLGSISANRLLSVESRLRK